MSGFINNSKLYVRYQISTLSSHKLLITLRNNLHFIHTEQVPAKEYPKDKPFINKSSAPQIIPNYKLGIPLLKDKGPTDRFITRRRNYSFDAANYLIKKPMKSPVKTLLDVLGQVDSVSSIWRKKLMDDLMRKENVIPGLKQTQVLRGDQDALATRKLAGSLVGKPARLIDEDSYEDALWASKPRTKPIIGAPDSVLDIPGFEPRPLAHLIDWSSKNVIAVGMRTSIIFYKIPIVSTTKLRRVENIFVYSLKWSTSGEKLGVSALMSKVSVYDLATEKFIWIATCSCLTENNVRCLAYCLCWSENDQHLLTGCRGLVSIYEAATGELVRTLTAHNVDILMMCFSPNYRYFVTTARDKAVRIYFWDNLLPFLDVSYYEPVRAVAWHPQENGILCVGGGMRDASLSLWNVNRQDPLSFRRVLFYGCVENLIWNKHSGELVVNWSYVKDRKRYTVVPVLASLDKIVDTINVNKESRVSSILWNPDQTQIGTQVDESMCIWNFFGSGYQYGQKYKSFKNSQPKYENISCNFKEFRYFNIR